ncbi:hypothetical protein BAE44_0014146 [Dichanthelium oligosanthes]|uniref:Uncharacterized protein n=1 Tax=Dichanthelium oligosanthes TaxID=888268 RepID=A0A1E5VIG1_9POAL|nr:hypothetical protein BAE44_0014146 [Dichanthelium oligosanthes]
MQNIGFKCIAKEADLICELLNHGAEPIDDIIQQSSMIRMCALSLVHLQGAQAVDAAAAMVGITKECKLMCDWIKTEDKLITFSMFPRHELDECRLIRIRTLNVMLSILKGSSFPSSKVSGKGDQNGVAVEFLLAAPWQDMHFSNVPVALMPVLNIWDSLVVNMQITQE